MIQEDDPDSSLKEFQGEIKTTYHLRKNYEEKVSVCKTTEEDSNP